MTQTKPETIRKPAWNSILFLVSVVAVIVTYLTKDRAIGLGILLGGAAAVLNFHMMFAGLRRTGFSDPALLRTRTFKGSMARIALMGVVFALAVLLPEINWLATITCFAAAYFACIVLLLRIPVDEGEPEDQAR